MGLSLPIETLLAHPTIDCNTNPNSISGIISYNTLGNTNTFCELCGIGQVRIVVTNPTHEDMANFSIRHDFDSDELEYVPGSTQGGGDPVISNGGRRLTWTAAQIPALSQIDGTASHFTFNTVEIIFNVRSRSGTEENLVNIDRDIQATAGFDYCPLDTNVPASVSTAKFPLQLHEPAPRIRKRGRNVDASQNSWRTTVYGNIDDDVIWQIRIRNSGLAALQDLKFDDLMQNGNFQINYACPTAGDANTITNNTNNGVAPAGLLDTNGGDCKHAASPINPIGNSIPDFRVDDPFGNPANDEPGAYVDVPAGGNTYIYLVGKILNSCTPNRTNRANNVEWGCEVDSPDGGITQTSTGATGGSSTTTLSSLVNNNGLQITRALTGLNTSQPVGSRGLMTLTVRNNTGGTIKNLELTNTLPIEYVVDSSFTPTFNITSTFGAYPGRVDTLSVTPAPADPLTFRTPVFTLTSSAPHPSYPDQENMIRHGDVVTIQFRVVMIPTDHFDNNANMDVTPEVTGDTTDPVNMHNTAGDQLANQLDVTFNNFCNGTQQSATYNDNFDSFPEDIDVSIPGGAVFILTSDPTQRLPLTVTLTNNGGHYADDYTAYVSFGSTMEVVTAPGSCTRLAVPPAPAILEVWEDPVDLPATAQIYECTDANLGTIGPNGGSIDLDFEVIKVRPTDPNYAARITEDDLTFRADVIGEVRLSDNTLTGSGALLTFPTVNTTIINNRANNYTLDSVRAKVIGFNLTKDLEGNCSENNPPVVGQEAFVEIGSTLR